MARQPIVSRTMKVTKVTVLCLNVKTGLSFPSTVNISGKFKDERSLLKAVKKIIDTDEVKGVHITETMQLTLRLGMTEQEFIEKARVLEEK